MRVSTRARYGVRAMIELARSPGGRHVSVRAVAESQDLSHKYLESIFARLKLAGLVRPVLGQGGGYVLARLPEKIDMLDVFVALEGDCAVIDCAQGPEPCDLRPECRSRRLWSKMHEAMASALKDTSLADLACDDQTDEDL